MFGTDVLPLSAITEKNEAMISILHISQTVLI